MKYPVILLRLIQIVMLFVFITLSNIDAYAVVKLTSFETNSDISLIQGTNATISASTTNVTDGYKSVCFTYKPGGAPSAIVSSPSTWDFSVTGGLAIDVVNENNNPQKLWIVLIDTQGNNWTYTSYLNANEARTIHVVYNNSNIPSQAYYGMMYFPDPYPTMITALLGSGTPVDFSRIKKIAFVLAYPSTTTKLYVDNIRLLDTFNMTVMLTNVSDQFGQNAFKTWAGKINSTSQLINRHISEATTLGIAKSPADRDKYGGWTSGPSYSPTGYFTAKYVNGKWWYVTPEGHLFYSIGMNEVRSNICTIVDNRNYMFQWIPSKNDAAYGQFFDIIYSSSYQKNLSTFNYYGANLYRAYGKTWYTDWQNRTVSRLKAWGFNTIGDWSDSTLCKQDKIPYTAGVNIAGNYNKISLDSNKVFPDPFDPIFYNAAVSYITRYLTNVYKNDPWCIGYFVDNELGWSSTPTNGSYALAAAILTQTSTSSPAKQAFINSLASKYQTISALNKAWGTTYTSWQAMGSPLKSLSLNPNMLADMSSFTTVIATKYFSIISGILRQYDTGKHLYLGCRFITTRVSQEALAVAAKYCDVISINHYNKTFESTDWGNLSSYNKPFMICEFHFGSLDSGLFWTGMVSSTNQTGRAYDYVSYFNSVVNTNYLVGLHWFQYVDEPLTGRPDGENGNIGFVDITDNPYSILCEKASSSNKTVYQMRY